MLPGLLMSGRSEPALIWIHARGAAAKVPILRWDLLQSECIQHQGCYRAPRHPRTI